MICLYPKCQLRNLALHSEGSKCAKSQAQSRSITKWHFILQNSQAAAWRRTITQSPVCSSSSSLLLNGSDCLASLALEFLSLWDVLTVIKVKINFPWEKVQLPWDLASWDIPHQTHTPSLIMISDLIWHSYLSSFYLFCIPTTSICWYIH